MTSIRCSDFLVGGGSRIVEHECNSVRRPLLSAFRRVVTRRWHRRGGVGLSDREGNGLGLTALSDTQYLPLTVGRSTASLVMWWIMYGLACVSIVPASMPIVVAPAQPRWWRDEARQGINAIEQYLGRNVP